MLFQRARVLLFCGALIFCLAGHTQTRDRIYLQTDRPDYVSGETVWFKAYLLSGLVPGSLGTNLFIDLVNDSGRAVRAGSLPVFGGVASGNIDLGTKLPQGIYYLRAYTKTQPSKDQYSAAVKTVYIFNPANAYLQALDDHRILFRPSSGNLVAGTGNTVFVNAADPLGKPAVTEGTVINAKNEQAAVFNTDSKGRGSFIITPVPGEQYTARVRFADGTAKNFELPKPDEHKVLVEITDAPKAKVFNVLIPEALRAGNAMTVRGFMDDNIVFEKNYTAAADHLAARIPVDELPAGLLQLIVTDAKKQKLGEAVTFIYSDSSFLPVQFHADTLDLSPGGKNVFSFTVPEGTIGSFSVSITDRERTRSTNENNIVTGLLLNQDSRNHSFISDMDVADHAALEKTLGNADWLDQSRYTGKNSIVIDSDYITIKGKLLNKENKKPITKGDLTFMFTTKDSVTSLLTSPVANDGSFLLQKLVFNGQQPFRYSLNGNSWKDIELSLDADDSKNLFSLPFTRPVILPDRSVFGDIAFKKQVVETYTYLSSDSISSTGLREVVVKSRKISPLQQVNDKYSRGMFNSLGTAKVIDLINEPPIGGGNILDYLQGKMPGLMISGSGTSYTIQSNRVISLTMMPPIRLFLNESETSINFLLGIQPRDVALVKYYPPGMANLPGVGIAGVLSIYTKKTEDGGRADVGMSQFSFNGYMPAKDFTNDFILSGKAVVGKRNTIYWDPNLLAEEDKPVYKIRFNNSDAARKLRVVIEGFTVDGRLVHFEKELE